jgi:hypothetical protein
VIEYLVLAGAAATFLSVLGGLCLLALFRFRGSRPRPRASESQGTAGFPFGGERVTLVNLLEEQAQEMERQRRRRKLEEMIGGLFDDPKGGN